MKHLIVSREYPPAAYAPGGIGAYVANIARLLAERGETVHVIAQRWPGAPAEREVLLDGRLIIHRIGENDIFGDHQPADRRRLESELHGLRQSPFPEQWFSWSAAFLIEQLIEQEDIDVIEGQEWEAPLYYFLLRRSIGMGPAQRPACIVHLHSTSEVIRHFNGDPGTPAYYPAMKRMEDFCIRAADALLCPSAYYAAYCRQRFGLPEDAITVIHLPVGFALALDRSAETWASGRICFIGRLEPRKGIIEWMEAARRVAQEDENVAFDIVGADIWGMKDGLLAKVPPALRQRFHFHGSRTRAELPIYLGRAKAAVVPSRWENFPNVCIEAMGSGLPVIATRLGGMIELIEDGSTGWLAPDTGVSGMVDGLADALRHCLATSPDERARMGAAAARAVRRICDNDATVDEQLAFRAALTRREAYAQPVTAPQPYKPVAGGAHIIIRATSAGEATLVLRTIQAQSVVPGAVVVVHRNAADIPDMGAHIRFLHRPDRMGADAWNAGFEALGSGREGGYWLFLDESDRLAPTCLEQMGKVFENRPDIGIAAAWTRRTRGETRLEAPLGAEPAYQLIGNDVPPASAFRATALGSGPVFPAGMTREQDVWRLANRLLAQGWTAITIPQTLLSCTLARPVTGWPEATALRAIRAELLDGLAEAAPGTALQLVDWFVPLPGVTQPPQTTPARVRLVLHYLRTIVLRPRWAVYLAAQRVRSVAINRRIRRAGQETAA